MNKDILGTLLMAGIILVPASIVWANDKYQTTWEFTSSWANITTTYQAEQSSIVPMPEHSQWSCKKDSVYNLNAKNYGAFSCISGSSVVIIGVGCDPLVASVAETHGKISSTISPIMDTTTFSIKCQTVLDTRK